MRPGLITHVRAKMFWRERLRRLAIGGLSFQSSMTRQACSRVRREHELPLNCALELRGGERRAKVTHSARQRFDHVCCATGERNVPQFWWMFATAATGRPHSGAQRHDAASPWLSGVGGFDKQRPRAVMAVTEDCAEDGDPNDGAEPVGGGPLPKPLCAPKPPMGPGQAVRDKAPEIQLATPRRAICVLPAGAESVHVPSGWGQHGG
jgi:hypothetical protein